MKKVQEIDQAFKQESEIGDKMIFRNCLEEPFQIYGLIHTKEGFFRMDPKVAEIVSEGVEYLNHHTAGGRVRFLTNSPEVAIQAKMTHVDHMDHFPLTGSAAFDLYDGDSLVGSFRPPLNIKDGYQSQLTFPKQKMHEVTIHFPLYAGVTELLIGLREGAVVLPAEEYATSLPVVYYGSSITQGGCASRPGNCYENIITRKLNCDHVNLGFSGSGKAEDPMIDYIAGLPMSVFVYDYDHNAPDATYLEATHEKMFQSIRKAQPDLPVIMVSRPKHQLTREEYLRRGIIMKTYLNALEAGDLNVYFVDGSAILNMLEENDGLVDGAHPNDMGFLCMAKAIGAIVKMVFENRR